MAKTNDGKPKSTRNASAHECAPEKHIFLSSESAADYQRLRENLRTKWFDECGPFNDLEIDFINLVAERQWQMLRCERQLNSVRDQLDISNPNPLNWTADDHKALMLMQRYFNAADRAFRNAWKDLLLLRKTRLTEAGETERLKRLYAKNKEDGLTECAPLTARPEPPGPPDFFITQPYPKSNQKPREEPDEHAPTEQ